MFMYEQRPTTTIYIDWGEQEVFTSLDDLVGRVAENAWTLEEYIEENQEDFPDYDERDWEDKYDEYFSEEIENYIDEECEIVRVDF